ncbi:MAG: hypothetical protein HY898_31845 [Deltaproteobacteria bacterium]|nr:hypothetical protein [Deltaproteobacteria bacterium]
MRLPQKIALLVLAALALVVSGDAQAGPDCLTAYGKTSCGHYCQAGDGQVRCAQTQHGTCAFTSGMLACWDPPTVLRFAYGERVPRPTCVSAGSQVACGYNCTTAYERPQCAQTPFGACRANEGRAVCWDPPGQIIASMGLRTPAATCMAAYGKVVCGYSCAAYDGLVRCSQTPGGFCRAERGTVVCWDPPLESIPAVLDPNAELACMEAAGARTCGFRCLSTRDKIACGADRRESCRLEPQGIECAAP